MSKQKELQLLINILNLFKKNEDINYIARCYFVGDDEQYQCLENDYYIDYLSRYQIKNNLSSNDELEDDFNQVAVHMISNKYITFYDCFINNADIWEFFVLYSLEDIEEQNIHEIYNELVDLIIMINDDIDDDLLEDKVVKTLKDLELEYNKEISK